MLIDSCVGAAECQASAAAPAGPDGEKNSFLNVDTPLQLGGSAVPLDSVAAVMTNWDHVPGWGGFTGCLQNMTFLDRVRRPWRAVTGRREAGLVRKGLLI